MNRVFLASSLLVSLVGFSFTADAQERDARVAPPHAEHDIRISAGAGMAATTETYKTGGTDAAYGASSLDVQGLYRRGVFEVGLALDVSGAFFHSSSIAVNGLVGLGWQTSSGFRLDILASLGVDMVSALGNGGFLSGNPGMTAALPNAGARGGISYRFGRSMAAFELGLWGHASSDLMNTSGTYTYTAANLAGPSGPPETKTVIGHTATAGAFLTAGVAFDVR